MTKPFLINLPSLPLEPSFPSVPLLPRDPLLPLIPEEPLEPLCVTILPSLFLLKLKNIVKT